MNNTFKYSKDRSMFTNIIYCVLSFLGLFLFSGILQLIFNVFIKNELVCSILAHIILVAFLIMLYYKDLRLEVKIYRDSFKENFKKSFKTYILGFMGMVFFNLLISIFLKNISANEEQVREMLYTSTFLSMISISIIAPLGEELVFRKSLDPIIKNKWVYVIISGILFGLAHIATNFLSGTFVLTDLIYILPYGSLGASFALMDRDTKTVCSSMVIHAIHNTFTALLLLALFKGGLL